MPRRIFLLTLFLIFYCGTAQTEERFPFIGEVVGGNVNVRAGQSINFERLCQLKKGQRVVVIKRNYSWYEIRIPEEAKAYISEKFLEPRVDNISMVIGHRVNVRAGPSERFTVLGQLTEGARVFVREKKGGWCAIEPIEGVTAWVAAKLVKFKNYQVPPARIIKEPAKEVRKERKQVKPTLLKKKAVEKKERILFESGRLEDLGRILSDRNIRYKLVINEEPAYYLIGPSRIFDPFINLDVKIQGKVRPDPEGAYIVPVVVVSRVNLILPNLKP